MKLRKFAWVLVLAMLVAGCGKEEEKEPSNTGSNIEINTGKDNTEKEENSGTVENNEPVENQDSTDTPTVGVYDAFIAYVRDMIVNEPIKMLDVQGLSGIGDAIMSSSTMVTGDENLAKFGYYIADVNNDSIPEIMLGRTDDTKMIYSLYTLVNGEPTLKFEGYYKNMYNYLGDGRFFYSGTGGAIYHMFGTYKLEGVELVCEDYYFTHEKDADFTEIGYFHNTSGVEDSTVSEEMTEEDFWPISSGLRQEAKDIEWTSFEK